MELQSDWNKQGKDNFEFVILEICDNYKERESFFLAKNAQNKYNLSDTVTNKGRKHSVESINKIKKARAKQIISKEVYKKNVEKRLAQNPNYFSEMASKYSVPFKCNETNEIFSTCMEAAKRFNIRPLIIWRILKGVVKKSKKTTYTFSYCQ